MNKKLRILFLTTIAALLAIIPGVFAADSDGASMTIIWITIGVAAIIAFGQAIMDHKFKWMKKSKMALWSGRATYIMLAIILALTGLSSAFDFELGGFSDKLWMFLLIPVGTFFVSWLVEKWKKKQVDKTTSASGAQNVGNISAGEEGKEGKADANVVAEINEMNKICDGIIAKEGDYDPSLVTFAKSVKGKDKEIMNLVYATKLVEQAQGKAPDATHLIKAEKIIWLDIIRNLMKKGEKGQVKDIIHEMKERMETEGIDTAAKAKLELSIEEAKKIKTEIKKLIKRLKKEKTSEIKGTREKKRKVLRVVKKKTVVKRNVPANIPTGVSPTG